MTEVPSDWRDWARMFELMNHLETLQRAERDYDQGPHPDHPALDIAAATWNVARTHDAWLALPAAVAVIASGIAAHMLRERYGQRGRVADALDAVVAARMGITAAAMASPSVQGQALATLGSVLIAQYEVDTTDEILGEAVHALGLALQLAADEPPARRSGIVLDLASALLFRVKAHGTREDADQALDALDSVLTLDATPQRPRLLDAKGTVLLARAELGDAASDVALAVVAMEEAVSLEPSPWHRVNLAVGLHVRGRVSGDRSDLERARGLIEEALPEVPSQNPERRRIEQMALTLKTNTADDAINAARRLVGATPAGSRGRVRSLAALGKALLAAGRDTGRSELLTEAIVELRRAVNEAATTQDARPSLLSDLALAHLERHILTGLATDLQLAREAGEEAVVSARSGSWERPELLLNFGIVLSVQAAASGKPEDLAAATAAFREACTLGAKGNLRMVLQAGNAWGTWAMEEGAVEDAAEAWTLASDAAEKIYALQLGRRRKTASLAEASGVAINAGFALARLGRFQDAVVVMERGRARLLGDALERERTDLDALSDAGHAGLVTDFLASAARVASFELDAEGRGDSQEEQDRHRRMARDALQHSTDAIRAVHGFVDFLSGASFEDVVDVAQHGAVTYLAATEAGGVAITVLPEGETRVTWLPELTRQNAVRASAVLLHPDGGQVGLRRHLPVVLDWLGQSTMQRLLNDLGRPKALTLIPLGVLSLLPWHAASWQDGPRGRRFVLDVATVRYAPSARVFAACRVAVTRRQVGPPVVVGPGSTHGCPLPYADAEAKAVAHLLGAELLNGAESTRERVLQACASAGLLHLACHGKANLAVPLLSALLLAEQEELTLRDLIARGGTHCRLVVLSACETAVAGLTVPDEGVNLASGFLQAGAAGVVASLWSVPDLATGLLMRRFHQELVKGQDPADALRLAQVWVRDGSTREKFNAFPDAYAEVSERMVSGPTRALWEAGNAHRHPEHWAAFAFVGA